MVVAVGLRSFWHKTEELLPAARAKNLRKKLITQVLDLWDVKRIPFDCSEETEETLGTCEEPREENPLTQSTGAFLLSREEEKEWEGLTPASKKEKWAKKAKKSTTYLDIELLPVLTAMYRLEIDVVVANTNGEKVRLRSG